MDRSGDGVTCRLPSGVFDAALTDFGDMQRRRVLAMYNRHRAMFAESLVAALLPGAKVVENPTAAWDIDWNIDGSPIRLQVKCSGQYLPMRETADAIANWKLKAPKYGWDPESKAKLDAGHHCEAFVLARHEGSDIREGWSFAVVTPDEVDGWSSVTAHRLARLRRRLVDGEHLPEELRAILSRTSVDGPSDAEIEATLRSGSVAVWSRLAQFRDVLPVAATSSTWVIKEPVFEGETRVIQMPWVDYDSRVVQVVQDLYELGVIVPFDWGSWDGLSQYPTGRGLDQAPIADAARLITVVVRGDRFSEGTLKAALDDGTMVRILDRLCAWYEGGSTG